MYYILIENNCFWILIDYFFLTQPKCMQEKGQCKNCQFMHQINSKNTIKTIRKFTSIRYSYVLTLQEKLWWCHLALINTKRGVAGKGRKEKHRKGKCRKNYRKGKYRKVKYRKAGHRNIKSCERKISNGKCRKGKCRIC